MRTSIRIDEQLLKKAKQLAIERKTSLTAIIGDALRESLAPKLLPGSTHSFIWSHFTTKACSPEWTWTTAPHSRI